jgi:hypothetical protein
MNEKTYNGWTNYETWCVNLWIGNDQGSEEQARELTLDAVKRHGKDDAPWHLADEFKGWITDEAPDLGATLYADLLGAALSEVDWVEIAEGYLDAYAEESEDEEEDGDLSRAAEIVNKNATPDQD